MDFWQRFESCAFEMAWGFNTEDTEFAQRTRSLKEAGDRFEYAEGIGTSAPKAKADPSDAMRPRDDTVFFLPLLAGGR
jgi:hypothetical protein